MDKTDDNTKTFIDEIFEDNFDVNTFHRDMETYVSFLTYVGNTILLKMIPSKRAQYNQLTNLSLL